MDHGRSSMKTTQVGRGGVRIARLRNYGGRVTGSACPNSVAAWYAGILMAIPRILVRIPHILMERRMLRGIEQPAGASGG